MEIKADDIITAMECHRINACHRCPYEGLHRCLDILCENTVKFINELTEENERLRERNITLEQKLMLLGCDEQYFFKPKVKGESDNVR